MAYTRAWSDVTPPGSQAANTIDDEIRNLRVDVHERLNDMVPDFTASAIARMGCRAWRSTNLAVVTSTDTAVGLDSESHDTAGLHDNSTNPSRITIPTNGNKGIWIFSANCFWAANATGTRVLKIRKNGTTLIAYTQVAVNSGTYGTSQHLVTQVLAPAVADYFEMVVFQDSGGNLNIDKSILTGAELNYFEAIQLL